MTHLAVFYNEVCGLLLFPREVSLDDIVSSGRVTVLSVQRCTGHVRSHAIAAPWRNCQTPGPAGNQEVTHQVYCSSAATDDLWAPVARLQSDWTTSTKRCGPTPDITGIPAQLATGESLLDSVTIANGATSGVDQPSTALHLADELLVKQPFRPFM